MDMKKNDSSKIGYFSLKHIISIVVAVVLVIAVGAGVTVAYFTDTVPTTTSTATFGVLDCEASINGMQYADSVVLNLEDYTDRKTLVNSAKFSFVTNSVNAYLRVAVGYRGINAETTSDEDTCVALNSEVPYYATYADANYYWKYLNGYYYLMDTKTNVPLEYVKGSTNEYILFGNSKVLAMPDVDKYNLDNSNLNISGVQLYMEAQAVQAANMPIISSALILDDLLSTANIFENPIPNYGYIIKYNTLGGIEVASEIVRNQSSIVIPMVGDRVVQWYESDQYDAGVFTGDALYTSNTVVQRTQIKSNLTLLASYSSDGYTVFFETEEDVVGNLPASTVVTESSKTLAFTPLLRGGYTHTGWKVKNSVPEVKMSVANNTITFDPAAYALGSAITLVPVWTPTEYTAIFTADSNYGYIIEQESDTYQVTYTIETKWNVDAGKLFPSVRCYDGFVFLGWKVVEIQSGCDVHFKVGDILTHYQNGIYGLTRFEAVFAVDASGGGGITESKIDIANADITPIPDQIFTGQAIKPTITVTYDNSILVKGTHYDVAYFNNVNAGSAYAIIAGRGDFEGIKYIDFSIIAYSVDDATITVEQIYYTGSPVTPTVTVTLDGVVIPSTNYTLSYSNNINVGKGRVQVQGLGNLTGSRNVEFDILALDISNAVITVADAPYTGSGVSPEVIVKYNGVILDPADYDVSYTNNVSVGTGTATVTGLGNLSGTKSANFTITYATITGSLTQDGKLVYSGSGQRPKLTNTLVAVGQQTISMTYSADGSAYSSSIPYFTEVGQHYMFWKANAPNHYELAGTIVIEITQKSLKSDSIYVYPIADQPYCYVPVTLLESDVIVTDNGIVLKQGVDYTLTYKNNNSAGTGTVVITGIADGNYVDFIEQTFTITSAYDYSGYLFFQQDPDNAQGLTVSAVGINLLPANLVLPSYVVISGANYFEASAGTTGAKPVTGITNAGFTNATHVTSLTLPSTLITISNDAFRGCTGISTLSIPASTKDIGDNAFNGCTGIGSLVIGAGTQTVGTKAFYGCTKLKNLSVYGGAIGANCFEGCSILASATFYDGVTSIGDSAFINVTSLTSRLVLPASLRRIGASAFAGCTGLTYLELNEGLTDIGASAFVSLSAINTDILMPTSIRNIGASAFSGCSNIQGALNMPNVITIGASAFDSCSKIGAVTIGSSCTSIGVSAFNNCTSISNITINGGAIGNTAFNGCTAATAITLAGSTSSIGTSSFASCTGAKTITIGDAVTSIGQSAFNGCTGANTLTIGLAVTSIGTSAFYGCTGITSIAYKARNCAALASGNNVFYNVRPSGTIALTIGNAVTQIPAYLFNPANNASYAPKIASITFQATSALATIHTYAFAYCSSLGSVSFPASLRTINAYAFYNCTGMSSLTLNAGLTTINASAFEACSNISSNLNLPSTVSTIATKAFYGCSKLNGAVTPTAVTTIGVSAFENCVGLDSVTTNTTLTKIDTSAFKGCTTITSVTIAKGVVGSSAFYGCTGMTTLTLNSGVTQVLDSAFYNCTGITSAINMPSTITSIGASAYYNCSKISGALTLTNCTSIGASAFYNCDKITSITISKGSIGNNAFDSAGGFTTVNLEGVTAMGDYVFKNAGSNITYSVPNSMTTVGAKTYNNFTGLKHLTVHNNISSIPAAAFFACSALISMNIPFVGNSARSAYSLGYMFGTSSYTGGAGTLQGATTYYIPSTLRTVNVAKDIFIGANAFANCSNITAIHLPETVLSIGYAAFTGCGSLNALTLPFTGSTKEWDIKTSNIRDNFGYVFGTASYTNGVQKNCYYGYSYNSSYSTSSSSCYLPYNLTEITILGDVKTAAFYNLVHFTKITLSEHTKKIGGYAFYGCTGLTQFTIPENVEYIGYRSFYNCTNISTLNYNAKNCQNLTQYQTFDYVGSADTNVGLSLTIGKNVEKIPNYLFASGDTSYNYLYNITFESGSALQEIGIYAFYYCGSYTSLTLPSNLKKIGESAFYYCQKLAGSLVIPDSVEEIGRNAFYVNNYVTSITIGTGLKIYYNAICMEGRETNQSVYLFNEMGSSSVTPTFTVGSQVTYIPPYLAYNAGYLKYVKIPHTVEYVGDYAFSNYSTLSTTTYSNALYLSNGTNAYAFLIKASSTSITSATIHPECRFIANDAFNGCTALTTVTVGTNVKCIGIRAFRGCTVLKTFNYNATNCADIYSGGTFYNAGVSSSGIAVTIGSNVTRIPNYLFYGAADYYPYIKTLTFTATSACKYIGDYAFYYCDDLATVSIPVSVEYIGVYAFYNCTAITSLTISGATLKLGEHAFNGCSNLSTVNLTGTTNIVSANGSIPSSATYTTAYGGGYYIGSSSNRYAMLSHTDASITSLTVHSSCKNIGANAFSNCTSTITSVTLPSGLKTISDYAFNWCYQLTALSIPSTVTYIGQYAFYYCYNLATINIPSGITKIEKYTFYNCDKIITLELPDTITYIGQYAFNECSELSNIVLPNNITIIDQYAFYYCTKLKAVTLPSKLERIENCAFNYCHALPSITFPSTLKYIGENAFYNCYALKAVSIPDSVEEIGQYAFYDCDALTTITIGKGVKKMGTNVFYSCNYVHTINYNAVNMNDYYQSSGNTEPSDAGWFSSCGTSAELAIKITIGSSVVRIPAYLFYYFNSNSSHPQTLTHVSNSVLQEIGMYAFYECYITSVTLPSSVKYIQKYAFYSLDSASISLPSSLIYIGQYAFQSSVFTSIDIPDSVQCIEIAAFASCSSLTTIEVGTDVNYIGNSAFDYCYYVTTLRWNATQCGDFVSSNRIFYQLGYNSGAVALTIGANVVSIPANFMYSYSSSSYYPKLSTVTFANNAALQTIGEYAFNYTYSAFTTSTWATTTWRINGSNVSVAASNFTTYSRSTYSQYRWTK